jgi:hypothetical protein
MIATERFDDSRVDEARKSLIERCLPAEVERTEYNIDSLQRDLFEYTGWDRCLKDFSVCISDRMYLTVDGWREAEDSLSIYSRRVPVDEIVNALNSYECSHTPHTASR